jgi:hypothetical protein
MHTDERIELTGPSPEIGVGLGLGDPATYTRE